MRQIFLLCLSLRQSTVILRDHTRLVNTAYNLAQAAEIQLVYLLLDYSVTDGKFYRLFIKYRVFFSYVAQSAQCVGSSCEVLLFYWVQIDLFWTWKVFSGAAKSRKPDNILIFWHQRKCWDGIFYFQSFVFFLMGNNISPMNSLAGSGSGGVLETDMSVLEVNGWKEFHRHGFNVLQH